MSTISFFKKFITCALAGLVIGASMFRICITYARGWMPRMGQQVVYRKSCADSVLTVVYFDVKDGCVFEFNTPQKRWVGTYTKEKDRLGISWRSPADKPVFSGVLSPASGSGRLTLQGMLGKDSMGVILEKIGH